MSLRMPQALLSSSIMFSNFVSRYHAPYAKLLSCCACWQQVYLAAIYTSVPVRMH